METTKNTLLLILSLVLAITLASCSKNVDFLKESIEIEEPPLEPPKDNDTISQELCLNFDERNPEKAIPAINRFLSNLSESLTLEQKFKELELWLNTQPCVQHARIVLPHGVPLAIYPIGELYVRFVDAEEGFFHSLVIHATTPITVVGLYRFKDLEDPNLIIGKWELVETRRSFPNALSPIFEEGREFTPTGYMEFKSDGRFGWFCYATEKFTLYETTYSANSRVVPWMVVQNNEIRVHPRQVQWGVQFELYYLKDSSGKMLPNPRCPPWPDGCPSRCNFGGMFINRDMFSITTTAWVEPQREYLITWVYKRKK